MGAAAKVSDPGQFVVSSRMKTAYTVCMFIGLIGFALLLINDQKRAWLAFLLPFFYFTSLALGGLFFTAIQHLTKAGWSVNIRRIPEAFTSFLPITAVSALILLIGSGKIYKWMDAAYVANDAILQGKVAYLNVPFFIIRLVLFIGGWLYFSNKIIGRSLAQDTSGDEALTHSQVKTSIGFILFFALSYSFFSVDLLMTLEAHWFSTIYGVYAFAGMFQSTLAFMILIILYLKKHGHLAGFVTEDHLHDLGKFLFAFTVFWAYIAFSQYMLIWYANLPEETGFIISRTEGVWLPVSIFLLLGKFIVPFIALLPRWAKRTPAHLAAVSILLLAMQYVDLYWLSYPIFYPDEIKFPLAEIAVFLGFLGMFLFTVTKFLSKNKIVPIKDPRIGESMHHHVVY
jgi:hypothetical protein